MADSASQKTRYESEIKQLKELRDTQKATIDKNIADSAAQKKKYESQIQTIKRT